MLRPARRHDFQDGNAVHFWQPDVEDDRVVGLALAQIMAFLAVKRTINDVTGVGQRRRQLPIEIGIVLNNQKAQLNSAQCLPITVPFTASTANCVTLPSKARSVSK